MKRPTRTRIGGGALTLALLACAWYLLAPTQLGGTVSYAVVYGSSMEPGLERGDLAILRHADGYEVGDVAAYRSPELNRVVLHRIVERDGDRYRFRGDNNDFVDQSKPERVKLVGRLWLHVPMAGSALAWLRAPAHAALATGLLAFLLLGGLGAKDQRRRRRPRASVELGQASVETVLLVSGAVAAVCCLAALAAFSRPVARAVPADGLYVQSGRFAYSAVVPPGPVYPSGRVRSGDTVFVNVAPDVGVRFDYRLVGQDVSDVSGTARLVARLRGDNGWQRSVPLEPARSFRGRTVSLRGTLQLGELLALGRRVQALTGTRSDGYALSIAPEIRVRGQLGAAPLSDRLAERLDFRLDESTLRLDAQGASSLVRTKRGSGTRLEPARTSVLGLDLKVETLRELAIFGTLAALLGLAYAAQSARRGRDGDEPDRIAARYGAWLVDVTPVNRPAESVVDVTTMDGLVKLAERYDRMILHEQRSGAHAYLVEEAGVVYRYSSGEPAPPSPLNGRRRNRSRDAAPQLHELGR